MVSKDRRQVEIISLVSDTEGEYSVSDLCGYFGVEVATIQRDLRELRERGISIHSIKNKVQLEAKLSETNLRKIASLYIASISGVISFPKNISLTVANLKDRTIHIFVKLANAIEKRELIALKYHKVFENVDVERTVRPYDIIGTSRDWRLIAESEGFMKQFIVQNIRGITPLGKHFERKKGFDSSDLFRNSFEYWRGDESFEIVLKFTKRVAPIVTDSVWIEDQEIKENKDGSILLSFKTNSLDQVADWILRWGKEVGVLEPPGLKKIVISRAKGTLAAYSKMR